MNSIQDAWSPCHNVSTILASIQSLLTDPNTASPANPEAAQLFQHYIQAYNKFITINTSFFLFLLFLLFFFFFGFCFKKSDLLQKLSGRCAVVLIDPWNHYKIP